MKQLERGDYVTVTTPDGRTIGVLVTDARFDPWGNGSWSGLIDPEDQEQG